MKNSWVMRSARYALAVALLASTACSANAGPSATTAVHYQPVAITATDGVLLSGRIFGEGRRWVILAHMYPVYPADQGNWSTFAGELAEKGFQVLTFDFRGYGGSEGPKEIGKIDLDLEGALDFTIERGANEVFLIGASMGGTASLKLAARRDVAGVITLSAPVSFQGLDVTQDMPNIDELKLFIASDGDVAAAQSLQMLSEETPEPNESLTLTGNAHGTNIFNGPEGQRAKDAIIAFLEQH